MVGLYRVAASVAIYRPERTEARPPHILRRPLYFPLSQFNGARPANMAIFFELKTPSSGRSQIKVADVIGPMPGTLRKILTLQRQIGLFWIVLPISVSILSISRCYPKALAAMCWSERNTPVFRSLWPVQGKTQRRYHQKHSAQLVECG